MIAIDTNLLIYAHRSGLPEHRPAQRAIKKAAAIHDGWGFSIFCLTEFWSVVTHPTCPNRPSEPGEANDFIDRLVTDGGAQIWLPESGFASRLTRLASSMKVTGARIFDLQIALVASESGAHTIWTHDGSFLPIKGLSVMDPLKD